ncbi:MAG: hypothetical protein V1817_02040, partial [Candidatus Micrarchaeota archaeon]
MATKLARVLSIGPGLGVERIPIAKRFRGKVVFFAVDNNLSQMHKNSRLKQLAETGTDEKEIAELCRRQKKHGVDLDFRNPERFREQLLKITGGKTGFFREIHFYAPLITRGKKRILDVWFWNSETAQKIADVLGEFLESGGRVYHTANRIGLSPLLGGLPKDGNYTMRKKALAERLGGLKNKMFLQRYGERLDEFSTPWNFGSAPA